ncbi:ATP-binding cassette domain-containing protein [Amphibacillus cookii]|uniref:ATP-binding cassette domain-containing protein n=1 Tax=Amphibacillus cookii TaxID=767787 RepID=UPI00195AC676|nr:ATP-binding cassette domain-containing protein [Amphibacillus cookii]MBM7539978.1 ABC-2 type transport system ATP-binding protein [Amphibacillus cookii]
MDSIVVNSLTKRFKGKTVLDNISLNIKGTYGLLGPNGAGKTTLMRTIATLLPISKGKITYGQVSWDQSAEVRKRIGYLPQHFSMYQNVKLMECLHHLAVLKGVSDKAYRTEQLEQIVHQVNLCDHKNKKIKHLSGGMLRRVGIAQALIGSPEILIIDEPTAGLDVEERVRFRSLLRSIGSNRIIIISTHIVEDLELACDNIGVLKNGRVLAEGRIEDISKFAKGHTWEVQIPIEEIEVLSNKFTIISSQQIKNKYTVRLLSDKQPLSSAILVEPRLEDGYLSLIRNDESEAR